MICGGKYPHRPVQGVHVLSKVLNDGETDKALSFPNLQALRLTSLLVDTTSLLDFVTAQPKLSNLKFKHVYLATHLPKAVQKWEAFGKLGHEPVPDLITYKGCTEWDYYNQPIPAITGWEGRNRDMGTQFRKIGAWPADEPDGIVVPQAPQIMEPFTDMSTNIQ